MIIKTAERLGTVKEYYFSRKLKEIGEMKANGAHVLNLGIGNPDMPPSEDTILKLRESALNPRNHGYQGYTGIPELRQGFSDFYRKYYDVILNPDNEILPLIGSKEGIMHISMAFLNPGDSVLIPDPGYPTYKAVSMLMQANIIPYDLTEKNNWQPDFDLLNRMDLTNVKIMWVNYPNMPTGQPANMELFRKLIDFGKKHHILICNDNPYSFILSKKPLSILSISGAKEIAIELNSLSKSHNMAGWRIGMAASSPEIISTVLRVKSNMDSGMFRPLQLAAAEALKADELWFDSVNDAYAERRQIVYDILDALNCSYDKEAEGMFVWAQVPEKYNGAEELSEYLLQKAHVFITPGFIFGDNGKDYLRISLCSDKEMLKESLDRINRLFSERTK
jgi:LL-diaminopimelate aminotransferase